MLSGFGDARALRRSKARRAKWKAPNWTETLGACEYVVEVSDEL